jgi:hypothetical protein
VQSNASENHILPGLDHLSKIEITRAIQMLEIRTRCSQEVRSCVREPSMGIPRREIVNQSRHWEDSRLLEHVAYDPVTIRVTGKIYGEVSEI